MSPFCNRNDVFLWRSWLSRLLVHGAMPVIWGGARHIRVYSLSNAFNCIGRENWSSQSRDSAAGRYRATSQAAATGHTGKWNASSQISIQTMSLLRVAARAISRPRISLTPRAALLPRAAAVLPQSRSRIPQYAAYSASAGLAKEEISARVLDVLKGFEKVDPTKLTETSRFSEDLGLDSLDAVEVVMAVEEEFAIEIPDEEADEIKSVKQAIEYIAKTPAAH
ncbi:acyl carrier protein [Laetiporus sulphureus 93-53]|uniref:Acyl carrier protein n=1 Tax=Laetiporus sulphureus 93-53 TaxID=1314785 RepID=A0A165DZI3_9APHY|nr:acyl carrier protein [Laetiporus sulphureus 93-53]KZT05958.1 acyl carrier protein [Laetiporus sulphureus 93-53]